MNPLRKHGDKTLHYIILGLALWAYFTGVLATYGKPLGPAIISGLVGVGASLLSLFLISIAIGNAGSGEAELVLLIVGLAIIPAYLYLASEHRLSGWDNFAASIIAGAIIVGGILLVEK